LKRFLAIGGLWLEMPFAAQARHRHWLKNILPHSPPFKASYLFKACPEWKMQQKILWAEVVKETKRWKSRWMVRDLLANGRCGRAVLDFLSSTDVGRLVPPLKEEGDAGSGVSEWELRDRRERQEEREGEVEALGAVDDMGDGEERPLFLATPSFMGSAGEE